MSVKMSIKENPEYLSLELSGDYDHPSAKSALDAVSQLSYEQSKWKALLDVRKVRGEVSGLDRFWMAKHAVSRFHGKVRLAIVVTPGQNRPGDRIFETATLNRGLSMKATTSMEEAFQWLREGPSERLNEIEAGGSEVQK